MPLFIVGKESFSLYRIRKVKRLVFMITISRNTRNYFTELCARKDKEIDDLQKQLGAAYNNAEANLTSVTNEFSATVMHLEKEKLIFVFVHLTNILIFLNRGELCNQISRLSQDAMDHSLTISGLQLQLKYINSIFMMTVCQFVLS